MQSIESLQTTTFSGRRFKRAQIEQIQEIVLTFKNLSRNELAFTICENFNWKTERGSLKINSALTMLEQLEKIGIVVLPKLQKTKTKGPNKPITHTMRTDPQKTLNCSLQDLGSITVNPVELKDYPLANEFVDRYHYLGYRHPFGSHIRYVIRQEETERILGYLFFTSSAWSLKCRDEWIGWERRHREKRLKYIVNNSRFLILPWIEVPNLASKVLSLVGRRIQEDWKNQFGYSPHLIETFVDTENYTGACYRAANWLCLGETSGRGRSDNGSGKKNIYVFALSHGFRAVLLGDTSSEENLQQRKVNGNSDIEQEFTKLWNKIAEVVKEVSSIYDEKWQIRKRAINTALLILLIYRFVCAKNTLGYGTIINQVWDNCGKLKINLPQVKPITQSSLCAARKKLDENIFKDINSAILRRFDDREDLWRGFRLFAVDGTKVHLPKSLTKDGYQVPTSGNYPQGLVSCLYLLKSKLPVDFELDKQADERKLALGHLKLLNEGDVVVYDRGYFSYYMLQQHQKSGVHAVFRLPKSQTFQEIVDFAECSENDQIVTIMPKSNISRLKNRFPDVVIAPLKLRLIKYEVGEESIILGTTLIEERYSSDIFPDLYKSRWGIEELYKISKNTIDVEDYHSKSERGVKQELYAHFSLITITRVFCNTIENKLNKKDPLSPNFTKGWQTNFKNGFETMTRNIETLFSESISTLANAASSLSLFISNQVHKFRPDRSFRRKSLKPIKKWTESSSKRRIRAEVQAAANY